MHTIILFPLYSKFPIAPETPATCCWIYARILHAIRAIRCCCGTPNAIQTGWLTSITYEAANNISGIFHLQHNCDLGSKYKVNRG